MTTAEGLLQFPLRSRRLENQVVSLLHLARVTFSWKVNKCLLNYSLTTLNVVGSKRQLLASLPLKSTLWERAGMLPLAVKGMHPKRQ